MVTAGIIGASGYTGAELLRLIAGHPEVHLALATADSQAGARAADLYPSLSVAYPDLVLDAFVPGAADGLDVVFLGLPHQASMALAPPGALKPPDNMAIPANLTPSSGG
jgi:N-acetyl-gamma-glutamyl-phosphate reductase